MSVLVDTSVWIDYFRGGNGSDELDSLISENLVATNDLILAELLPFLIVKKQFPVVKLLQAVNCLTMKIDWEEIIEFQVTCLRSGANGVGIPDLIIAQNAKSNDCKVYSLDKHFRLLNRLVKVKLY